MTSNASLQPFGADIWLDHAPVRIVGTRLTSTMTLIRLGSGGLLVYSPVALTPARQAAADALGPVEHLYAPNLFHHLWLGEWAAAYPNARVHAPKRLGKKRPALHIDRFHGAQPEPAFVGLLDEVHIDGSRMDETVLFHRPSRTLIVADLVHNVGRPKGSWTQLYARCMGFYDRVALSRVLRWTAFTDRAAARASVDQLLALPIERLVFGHGAPLPKGGHEALAEAYAWLAR
jgi:hypothetical protein